MTHLSPIVALLDVRIVDGKKRSGTCSIAASYALMCGLTSEKTHANSDFILEIRTCLYVGIVIPLKNRREHGKNMEKRMSLFEKKRCPVQAPGRDGAGGSSRIEAVLQRLG